MTIRPNAATWRALHHRSEQGAATLEGVGMYAVAAVLAVAVMLAAIGASPILGDKFRHAMCLVTTLGQGPCEPSRSSAEDHKPSEPCVVAADGHNGAVEVSLGVTVGGSKRFAVEELNNGKYRVTRGTGGKLGAYPGVGANISMTWDDKNYGGTAKLEAGGAAEFTGGETYYANNRDEANNLEWAVSEEVSDEVLGSGPARWLTDRALAILGMDHALPTPDETYVEGGASADMDAQATLLISNGQAGASVQALLGKRQGADGTSTTYFQASLDANLSAASWVSDDETNQTVHAKAGLEGKAETILEVERDAKGNITAVRVKSVLSGTAEAVEQGGTVNDGPGRKRGYVEKMVVLPIRSATDQAIAQRYLNAAGMGPLGGFRDLRTGAQNYLPIINPLDALGATKGFAQAASRRGFVTQQTFDDNPSSYGPTFDAEFLAKVGGGVKVDTVNRVATDAQYWDGSNMARWEGCGGE